MALIDKEGLTLACMRIAGLEPDEHNADFTVKNKFPLREEQKNKIKSALHIYKHLLSKDFTDDKKYCHFQIAKWLCSQVIETDNKYNIIIYDKYCRRKYFWNGGEELTTPSKVKQTLHEESKKTEDTNLYIALLADRDKKQSNLIAVEKLGAEQAKEIDKLKNENSHLKELVSVNPETPEILSSKQEKTYLNIIGGLLNLLLGRSSSGRKCSIFKTQTSIIDFLIGDSEGRIQGLKQRTLEGVFSAAKKSIDNN